MVREGQLELIPLEGGLTVMPSTICFTKEQEVYFGRTAIELYLSLIGQVPIRYKFTDLRELASVFESELNDPFVNADNGMVLVSTAGEDEILDLPARLFQSLKTALRDPHFHGATIYGHYYAVEDLIAEVLRRIRRYAEAYLGEPVEAAVIGRPVSYVPLTQPAHVTPEEINCVAHERMLVAARKAGFGQAALEREPVAAARHLRRLLPEGSCALIFDFGGGTLDLALVQISRAERPQILATHGLTLGGDDFDSAIMEHALLKHFGAGTTLGPKGLPFPQNLLEPLLHWQTISLLATPANAAHIAAVKRQSNVPQAVENLQRLVREGLGFRLFQLIEAAKIALSDATATQISLHEKGLHIDEGLTRRQFVSAITQHLGQIENALEATLRQAQLAPQAVDTVLMTGGSSLVPVVQGMIKRLFGPDKVRTADPFTSIAAGLGIIASQDGVVQPLAGIESSATQARLEAEAVAIGDRVIFWRGQQSVEGLVVGRAGGQLHDATLIIEFWDSEIEQFVSTMRHETKVRRVQDEQQENA
ncbi:MAG: Hsp70 family protein [Anaerolineae bacterium]|nr:Hsp70 family protein [Anaerolineae bacterium]